MTTSADQPVPLISTGELPSGEAVAALVTRAYENYRDVQVGAVPYRISYRAVTPKREQCENLLVPVCLSSSHIAYGSARMEPVFMVLGQSAAIAACLAIDQDIAVQDVRYPALQKELRAAGQVLGDAAPLREQASCPTVQGAAQ